MFARTKFDQFIFVQNGPPQGACGEAECTVGHVASRPGGQQRRMQTSIEHWIFSATGGFANAWAAWWTIVTFFENGNWVWTQLHLIATRDGCHDRRNQHYTLH